MAFPHIQWLIVVRPVDEVHCVMPPHRHFKYCRIVAVVGISNILTKEKRGCSDLQEVERKRRHRKKQELKSTASTDVS